MGSRKRKSMFGSRVFYIILSVIAAIAIWMYISIQENPDIQTTISNIPVEFEGTDQLEDRNLIVSSEDYTQINLRIEGKRQHVLKLDAASVRVSVDLSDITASGVYQCIYDVIFPSGTDETKLSILSASTEYITVEIENLISKPMPVRGVYVGDIDEGYSAGEPECKPEMITISGPEEYATQVAYALAEVERDSISKTLTEKVSVRLMDEEGNEVDPTNLTVDPTEVDVTIPVYMLKEVALNVSLIHGAGSTDTNTIVSIDPPTITLLGDPETLAAVNSIQLATIDLTDIITTDSRSYTIVIPNDTTNVSGISTADVSVEVVGLATKRLSATNITVTNVTDGYNADIITQSLDILLRGPEESVEAVTAENIRIVADLSNISKSEGSFSVEAKVIVDGYTDVGAIGDYKVSLYLSKQ